MKYTNPNIESSYRSHDLGKTLYDLVLKLKPKKIIEFGTLNGYSAICMAMALDELKEGKIISYDLWEAYKFNKGNKASVRELIEAMDLQGYISLQTGDFNHWIPEPFDLFHLDISNDGEKIKKLADKTKDNGTVIFEGGTSERDHALWMSKFNKMPISASGVKYRVINADFPSISMLI